MPEYTLRNIDPRLWSRFVERAKLEGWPTKALFVSLMEAYADGEIAPSERPPRDMSEHAWLRAHYRAVAGAPDFSAIDDDQRWFRLVDHVLSTPASSYWQALHQMPQDERREILQWLDYTSAMPIRQILTLRAIASIGEGPSLTGNRRVFQYEVLGLPPGQQAFIADFEGGWRLLRVVDGQQGNWSNPHLNKEEALDTLARALHEDDA
jgi:hypothetical protein